MIRIPIKNGNIDAALDKLKVAKDAQNRKFEEQVAAFFAPKDDDEAGQKQAAPRAPSYQSILARSRRMG